MLDLWVCDQAWWWLHMILIFGNPDTEPRHLHTAARFLSGVRGRCVLSKISHIKLGFYPWRLVTPPPASEYISISNLDLIQILLLLQKNWTALNRAARHISLHVTDQCQGGDQLCLTACCCTPVTIDKDCNIIHYQCLSVYLYQNIEFSHVQVGLQLIVNGSPFGSHHSGCCRS